MLYMVIEHFRDQSAQKVYQRAHSQGRMLPDGLHYIDSWVDTSFERCFQLMECDDIALFEEWFQHWSDLVKFEVIPVHTSQQAFEAFKNESLSIPTKVPDPSE